MGYGAARVRHIVDEKPGNEGVQRQIKNPQKKAGDGNAVEPKLEVGGSVGLGCFPGFHGITTSSGIGGDRGGRYPQRGPCGWLTGIHFW